MKITMYELLGMVKDGKAPKKIKINNDNLTLSKTNIIQYNFERSGQLNWDYYIENYRLDEKIVEILEEEPKVQVELTEKEYLEYLDKISEYMESVRNYIPKPSFLKLEEEKKIPEKLEEFGLIQYSLDYVDYKNIEVLKEWLNKDFQTIYNTLDLIIKNQNKLIDYLKSKGDE